MKTTLNMPQSEFRKYKESGSEQRHTELFQDPKGKTASHEDFTHPQQRDSDLQNLGDNSTSSLSIDKADAGSDGKNFSLEAAQAAGGYTNKVGSMTHDGGTPEATLSYDAFPGATAKLLENLQIGMKKLDTAPRYLLLLHIVSAGKQEENLGSDEMSVIMITGKLHDLQDPDVSFTLFIQ
ncbi:unnamed protein product [Protopolystoma xenopodis]|uniref:Uncharacterized protein n=1 Tax=Protopolystoma xenopodis TaxID=117903 RepID=A0A3S5BCH8_9PLAT|nr:unnamed protein product [Protopolystoma xenopodis]